MTREQRATVKAAIDVRRRILARDERPTTCDYCGCELVFEHGSRPTRRFCTDSHRKRWNDTYGTFLPEPAWSAA